MALELRAAGLDVRQQYKTKVEYRGSVVGEYTADLLIADTPLVEVKAVKAFDDAHRMQCFNYLKATGLRLCLLLNFGNPRLEIKRIVNAL